MKAYKYKAVQKLPATAIIVSQFARDGNITVGYVYMKYKRGKASYGIVNFQGVNFVVPERVVKNV